MKEMTMGLLEENEKAAPPTPEALAAVRSAERPPMHTESAEWAGQAYIAGEQEVTGESTQESDGSDAGAARDSGSGGV